VPAERTSDARTRLAESGAVFGLVLGLLLGSGVTFVAMSGDEGASRAGNDEVLGSASDPAQVPGAGGATGTGTAPGDGAGPGGAAAGTGPDAGPVDPGAAGSGSGVVGPAAEDAPGARSGPGGTGSGASGGRAGRGVTADSIKIGIAYPDLSAVRTLGPAYDNGDVKAQWEALRKGWKEQGLLPVNGRDVQFVYATYNVVDQADQRAACTELVSDEKVFAVVGVAYFATGSDCVARQFRTPLLTSDGPAEASFSRTPYLFSLGVSADRLLRNLVHWAERGGVLKGKTIGIYSAAEPDDRALLASTIKRELARLGYKVKVEVETSQPLGGPQDAVAVQRFRSEAVDLALLFTSKGGFLQQAQAQGYRPQYLDSDHDFGTSDTATSNYPPEQFDGTRGFTARRVGEAAGGLPLDREQESCLANYEKHTGDRVTRPNRNGNEVAEFSYVLTSCDEGQILLAGLKAAGAVPTADGFVRGMETLRSVPLRRYAPVSFTPRRHDGSDLARTVTWSKDCRCWRATDRFAPFPVP